MRCINTETCFKLKASTGFIRGTLIFSFSLSYEAVKLIGCLFDVAGYAGSVPQRAHIPCREVRLFYPLFSAFAEVVGFGSRDVVSK